MLFHCIFVCLFTCCNTINSRDEENGYQLSEVAKEVEDAGDCGLQGTRGLSEGERQTCVG